MQKFADWANSRTPVQAISSQTNSLVGKEVWDQFVTPIELATITGALDAANIAYAWAIDPMFAVEPGEKRIAPLFTVDGQQYDAGQILAVLWKDGVPGTLYLSDGTDPDVNNQTPFRFRADPVAPVVPAPRPNPGPTSAADLSNSSGVTASGGFDQGKALEEILFNLRKGSGWTKFQ